jgi:hypothetical protein
MYYLICPISNSKLENVEKMGQNLDPYKISENPINLKAVCESQLEMQPKLVTAHMRYDKWCRCYV